ncbi:MAG: adenylate/guanylate cyclase domain-containing protein [Alphaproteobacteria bacterium]|nr:adenylate/guanylate cyclase domain-containing protein [Alphaproteobacteria bacterium]
MKERTRKRLLLLGGIAAGSALFAMAYGPIIGQFQGFEVSPGVLLRFGIHGLMFGVFVGWFEVFYANGVGAEWFRRQPFISSVLIKTTLMTFIIIAVLLFGGMMILPERLAADNALTFLVIDVVVAFGLALVFQLILAVRSVVGGRVLGNLIIGRYHRPLKEERIFLFLDLAGSTAMAEKMGDIAAQSLITRFFFDVAQVTLAYGGETHRYIGDEVVVTWPIERGLRDAACLECCFAIEDRIAKRAADYERRFGVVPSYRIGLHGGPVVAAECGDDKHEIVYFGDTINTAARIEEYCKESGYSLLLSGDLISKMTLPKKLKAKLVGNVQFRGRVSETEIYNVARSET